MSPSKDAYWDELGVAWRAIDPTLSAVEPRLQMRLRWQALWANLILMTGIPLGVAGLIVGALTAWVGWSEGPLNFTTRGTAIFLVSLLLGYAAWNLRVGTRAVTRSLAEMLELAILRAQKASLAVKAGYIAVAVAASLGLLGYAIRKHSGHPPAMSPIEPLAMLALFCAVLAIYHRRLSDELAKLRYLKEVVTSESPQA